MFKTRLLLLIVAMISTIVFAWGLSYIFANPYATGLVGAIATISFICTPFIFASSCFMIVFSFFKVHETIDGRLAYNPSNFYWKMLGKFYKENWKDTVSLCDAFQKTVIFVFIAFTSVICAVMLTLFGGILIYTFLTVGFPQLSLSPKQLLTILCFSSALLSLVIFATAKELEDTRVKLIGEYLSFVLLFFGLVAGPIYGAGINEYLRGVKIAIGILAVYALVIFGSLYLFRMVSSGNNLLTRFFKAMKENLCPILVADIPKA